MKLKRLLVVLLILLVPVVGSAGCRRALQDGVSIGVTDGLSDGIAEVLSGLVTSFGVPAGA